MNKYTLKELATIFSAKGYLPLDRFTHYFTLRFGYTERQALEAYKLWTEFPNNIHDEESCKVLDEIIPKALEIVEELQTSWELGSFINLTYDEKEWRKLIYIQNDEVKELVLDLHNSSDIITYAELLKQDIKTKALLRLCHEINVKNSNDNFKVFEGDIFNTNDLFWGTDKSNVYIAQKNDTFKKLLYTKGKGYLRNGKPNYDDGSFNSHCLTLRDWIKIGNATTDLAILSDDGVGE